VFHRLTRLGVAMSLIKSERRAMTPVGIGAMVDWSVLGIMVDFGNGVPYTSAQAGGTMQLFPRPKIDSLKHRVTQGCHGGMSCSRRRGRPNCCSLQNGLANRRLNPTREDDWASPLNWSVSRLAPTIRLRSW
jgi:hypothetical protein